MVGQPGKQVNVRFVFGKVGLASGRVARSRAAKPAPHADFADKSQSLSALAHRASLIFAGRNLAEESGAGQADAAQAASRSESVSGDSSPASRGPRGGSAARFPLRPEASAGQAAFQTSENPNQIAAFAASRPAPSGFFPILPADVSAVASSSEVFRSLGSRTDPVLHVRFPAPWSVVAENRKNQNWRCLLNLVRTAVLGP